VRRAVILLLAFAMAGCSASGPGYMYGSTGGGFNSAREQQQR
jgi:predicted small lipoprotein YifL